MTYLPLSRKWRPKTFEDVVGQPHATQALTAALNAGHIHSAYLFSGTRGVGKTTLARIIARSLNCKVGMSAKPCGHCEHCTAMDEGHFFDLIEVDAASRTKVEETRALLENVPYAPTHGRYKVYLIDEVHMLSMHSFNALLKTLEEPPRHVVFILATTEPMRVPQTVLSRCLQFYLKPIAPPVIVQRLAFILEQEHLSYDPKALLPIAEAAKGSLRDALSLLEQALLMSSGRLEVQSIYTVTGGIPEEYLLRLLEALIQGNAESLMQCAKKIEERSPEYEEVLSELSTLLQKIAVLQFVPMGEESVPHFNLCLAFAKKLSKEEVQLYYQMALVGARDLALCSHRASGFLMILLRMLAFRPTFPSSSAKAEEPELSSEKVENRSPIPPWPEVAKALKLTGLARELIIHSTFKRKEGKTIELGLGASVFPLLNERSKEQIREALSHYFGETIDLHMVSDDESGPAETPQAVWEKQRKNKLDSDVAVQVFLKTFEGKVQV